MLAALSFFPMAFFFFVFAGFHSPLALLAVDNCPDMNNLMLAQTQGAESVFLNQSTFHLVNLTRDMTYEESFQYWGNKP